MSDGQVFVWLAAGIGGWLIVGFTGAVLFGRAVRLGDEKDRHTTAALVVAHDSDDADAALELIADQPVDAVSVDEVDRRFWGLVTGLRGVSS